MAINISVDRANATVESTETLTNGRVGLQINFTFSSDWDGLGKTVFFRAGEKYEDVILTSNTVTVPSSVMEDSGVSLIVGVHGVGATDVIPTIWCACGQILPAGSVSEADNYEVPTDDVVDQLTAAITNIGSQASAAASSAASAASIAARVESNEIHSLIADSSEANQTGVASVEYIEDRSEGYRDVVLKFKNLKGAKGETGAAGAKGDSSIVTVYEADEVELATKQELDQAIAAISSGGSGSVMTAVTPEMYGAVGDGVHDDASAIKAALETGIRVVMKKDLYIFSDVVISDKNVILDGCGYTIYASNAQLSFGCQTHEADDDEHSIVMYTETAKVVDWAPYHRGYISYNGINPTPSKETYTSQSVVWWNEHKLDIRNLNVRLVNSNAKSGLLIYRYTNGYIDGVNVIAETDGMAGIAAQACVNFTIKNCYCEGFTSKSNTSGWGYGIFVAGNNILVTGCTMKNNKNDIACCSDYNYFSTGIKYVDCTCVREFNAADTRPSGGDVLQQSIDCHGSAHNPIFNNIHVIESCADVTSNKWTVVMNIRCPHATISNVDITYPVDGAAYIAFDEICESADIRGLHAPNVYIRPDNGGHLEQAYYTNHGMRNLNICDSDILGVTNCLNWIHINLNNTRVHGQIKDYNYLKAVGCEFLSDISLTAGNPVLSAKDRTILMNCVIHFPANSTSDNFAIKANTNTVYMHDCILYGPTNMRIFNNTQTQVDGNSEEDYEAFHVGEALVGTEQILGFQSALDGNNLV